MNNQPLVFERTFPASIATVWQALTDKDEMKKWYFDLAEFKTEPGFTFSFSAGPDDKKYLHLCQVTEVITGKKITYSWRYDGYEGISYISFELFGDGDTTKLRLTHTGIETFPAGNADFARENFVGGWTYFMDTSLKSFLEKSSQ